MQPTPPRARCVHLTRRSRPPQAAPSCSQPCRCASRLLARLVTRAASGRAARWTRRTAPCASSRLTPRHLVRRRAPPRPFAPRPFDFSRPPAPDDAPARRCGSVALSGCGHRMHTSCAALAEARYVALPSFERVTPNAHCARPQSTVFARSGGSGLCPLCRVPFALFLAPREASFRGFRLRVKPLHGFRPVARALPHPTLSSFPFVPSILTSVLTSLCLGGPRGGDWGGAFAQHLLRFRAVRPREVPRSALRRHRLRVLRGACCAALHAHKIQNNKEEKRKKSHTFCFR